ncbi:hypothetical protein INT47_000376 [Mucor saturninus]|uniref:Zn(2)-C6 fungal-type domain-containing protein n=1 Tax=Mucor saturninus TaxID=64648 RepID=A0A8H7QTV0_9FUNG|nr:hypothetical protein INT47_000376 [Mucor saturninus]
MSLSPGENCRAHRRKCVAFDKTSCDRCHKLELTCIFKFTETTIKAPKPVISTSKRNKLFDAVWTLKKESDSIQLQLSQLQSVLDLRPSCGCVDPCTHNLKLLPKQSSSRWEVTISSNHNGFAQFQTTVQSLSDLSKFLNEAVSLLKCNGYIDKLSETSGKQVLPVTYKTLKVEALIRKLIGIPMGNNSCKALAWMDSGRRTQLKRQAIDRYFECSGLCDPILIYSYHYPLLIESPNSLIATALVAKIAYSKCQHIDMTGCDFTRAEFARSCRVEAKSLLEEVLFDSEPTLEICIALWALCFSSMYALEPTEARFQSSICWRMVIQLKPKYIKMRHPSLEDNIKAESWKRLFYMARYTEFNFRMSHDLVRDFTSIAHDTEIGLPTPLPCEATDDRFVISVFCYRYVTQLTTNAAGITKDNLAEITGLRLFAGVIDQIQSAALQYQENTLLQMWHGIPDNLRLGSGPFKITETNEINECHNPCVLRFNMVFYIYWMNLHSRLMISPHSTDLAGASFSRFDGDRSLIVASINSDTATKIFVAISSRYPCVLEIHWLTMCIEVLTLLTTAANEYIRNRAIYNLELATKILNLQLEAIGYDQSRPDSPYLDKLKEIINTHTWL